MGNKRIYELVEGTPTGNSEIVFDSSGQGAAQKVKIKDMGLVTKTSPLVTTLTVAGWSSDTQTISNAYFETSGYVYFVTASPDSVSDYSEAFIYADEVTVAGQMTFHCENTPSVAIDVQIMKVQVAV